MYVSHIHDDSHVTSHVLCHTLAPKFLSTNTQQSYAHYSTYTPTLTNNDTSDQATHSSNQHRTAEEKPDNWSATISHTQFAPAQQRCQHIPYQICTCTAVAKSLPLAHVEKEVFVTTFPEALAHREPPCELGSPALVYSFEHIELPAKLLDYILRSNKSNINQCAPRPSRHSFQMQSAVSSWCVFHPFLTLHPPSSPAASLSPSFLKYIPQGRLFQNQEWYFEPAREQNPQNTPACRYILWIRGGFKIS